MQRRIGTVTLVAVGVALIAGTLAFQMFSRAPAFERMTSDFAKNVTPATVAALRADVAKLQAAGTELQSTGIPALARLLTEVSEHGALLGAPTTPNNPRGYKDRSQCLYCPQAKFLDAVAKLSRR